MPGLERSPNSFDHLEAHRVSAFRILKYDTRHGLGLLPSRRKPGSATALEPV